AAEKHLVAYVVARSGETCNIDQLRQYLKDRVPPQMVPTFIVPLPRLPQTLNGKVDRKILPPPQTVRLQSDVPLRTLSREARERLLAGIWQEVLQRDDIGRHEPFFEVSDDSWLAERLLLRVQRDLRVVLTLEDLAAAPTVARLAERVLSAHPLPEG